MSNRYASFDEYGFRHLPQHLAHSERVEQLRGMLFDFDWLHAKLATTDVNALIADYDLLPNGTSLRLTQRALRLSMHVLTQDKAQLAGQLTGRLMTQEIPEIQTMLEQAKQWKSAPWLHPLTPALTPPGELLVRTQTSPDPITAIAVTPNGRRVIAALLWSLQKRVVHQKRGQTRVAGASGNFPLDNSLKVWDLESGEDLCTLTGHTGRVTAVAVTLDGHHVISSSWDRTLKVWSLKNKQVLCTLKGHTDKVTAVAVTSDGQRAISASTDHTLKVWDLDSGVALLTLNGHTKHVNTVAMTPDGQYAVSGAGSSSSFLVFGNDNTLKVWDLKDGKLLRTLRGHKGWVRAVAIMPDGRHVISASRDHTLIVWDLRSGKRMLTLCGHTNDVMAVAVTPDGRRAVSASWDHTLKIWDLNDGTELRTLRGHDGWVEAVTVTPDGRYIVSASRDCTLKVWSLGIE